jgi:hypothetical protein
MDPKAITRKLACKPCVGRLSALLLLALAAAGLAGCDENDPTGTDLTDTSQGGQAAAASVTATGDDVAANVASSATASLNTGNLPLPLFQVDSSTWPAFHILEKGTSVSGRFGINNFANTFPALYAETNGSGAGVRGRNYGQGEAGHFEIDNASNPSGALVAKTSGSGAAVTGIATGGGVAGWFDGHQNAAIYARSLGSYGNGGSFQIVKSSNPNDAVRAETYGSGYAVHGVAYNSGNGGYFEKLSATSSASALAARTKGTGWAGVFVATNGGKGVYIQTNGGPGLQVVGGSKNAVVHTPSGAKALYTEEATEVWFTDYGFAKLQHGRARILFDPSFAQTINPEEPYHVFVQSYGDAELYVRERTPLGFEVALRAGDPNAQFSYRIVAKRLGFEGKRLEAAPWADHMSARD